MAGNKMLIAGSLPLLASASTGAISADIKTQSSTQSLWHNDSFHSLNDLGNTVAIPGNKTDFF